MIKRRFYKQDHGDNSGSSDSLSSNDFDFVHEVDAEEDQIEEGKENDKKSLAYQSPGSGYESEDSSDNQDENDASDLLTNEEENDDDALDSTKDNKRIVEFPDHENERASGIEEKTIDPNDPIQVEIAKFILKCKSIFKCRLCSRILCLNEATVRAHLTSKRHARSKKLLAEGRLKLMLNSDGELEEEQETHAERHARILALSQESFVLKMRKTGRQRQSHRRKKRMHGSNTGESEASVEKAVKKLRKD